MGEHLQVVVLHIIAPEGNNHTEQIDNGGLQYGRGIAKRDELRVTQRVSKRLTSSQKGWLNTCHSHSSLQRRCLQTRGRC